jgi:NTP pyrophosphatase (non-canonical NTP hydrolase)
MEFDDYQQRASTTALFPKNELEYQTMYLSMGLAGETGEVIEKIKHIIRDADGVVGQEAREGVKKEMGDVLWYLSQLARILGISFDDIASANIEKLADRAQRGVLKGTGDER